MQRPYLSVTSLTHARLRLSGTFHRERKSPSEARKPFADEPGRETEGQPERTRMAETDPKTVQDLTAVVRRPRWPKAAPGGYGRVRCSRWGCYGDGRGRQEAFGEGQDLGVMETARASKRPLGWDKALVAMEPAGAF
uniref:Uncharacterized protein n=1 Tax=Sphaerodactylus townsendi TaxID=933632 RepID=A0ACB8EAT2_9SAUR